MILVFLMVRVMVGVTTNFLLLLAAAVVAKEYLYAFSICRRMYQFQDIKVNLYI